jgi:4a-hydroxytetrahydrobiopterin dehydratase
MKKMTEAEIKAALAGTPEWTGVGETIQKTFQFADFVESMRFVNRVADAAERGRHHPDILIRYNKVTLTLATHDAGGITEKDFELARAVDALVDGAAEKGRKAKGG